MKFGALFTALLILLSALALAMPDSADAARMGGGRSFGSKPSMSQSAPAPRQQSSMAQRQGTAGAAMAKPGLLGGMGGLFGGLLAGTLLGSLLSGGGFSGGGFMDILLLGILAFLGYKLFMRFRSRPAPQPAAAGAGGMFGGHNFQEAPQPMQREAASGWDALAGNASNPAAFSEQTSVNIPAGFDVDEFLRGAKMAYNRMQKSWDKRDLDDIAQFATAAVMDVLKTQMAEDPKPSNTEIMLVNAQLLGVEKEGSDERAQVFFDVLMRETPDQAQPSQAREIWHFLRDGEKGEWKLDGIQQVD